MWSYTKKNVTRETPKSDKPKPADPIGDICTSLSTEPWDWGPGKSKDGSSLLTHKSGAYVVWVIDHGGDASAWISFGSPSPPHRIDWDAERLVTAIHAGIALKIKCPERPVSPAPSPEGDLPFAEEVTEPETPKVRTREEVLRQRREGKGGSGCCDRYANMMACDCLRYAV